MPAKKYSGSGSKPHSSRHRHSERMSNPAFSYYPGDHMLHFYRWTSPPGVMKILCIIIIIMCVAIFACVASTLVWDYDMSMMGLGGGAGLMPGYGSSYGSGSYGGTYGSSYGGSYGSGIGGGGAGMGGYGYGGGTQMDPKAGKGFIIAISAITFIAVLVIFILVVSRQDSSRSPKFFLAAIVICAILAFLMIIATIVYLVAVNPTAQSSGSMAYNQIRQICAQYQNQNQAQTQGIFINQYLYHYCVVEPQEAIAIVLGFLVFVGLIILLVFAVKTRSNIRRWGGENILWEEVKVVSDPRHSVGEWVNNVSGEPEVMLNDYNPKVGNSMDYLEKPDNNRPIYLPGDSDINSSLDGIRGKSKDYGGADSGDELEEVDFSDSFPSILDEQERLNYKLEFDNDHYEYKGLQAELDNINHKLEDMNHKLDRHQEGSPLYHELMEEYTRLRNLKKTSDYQTKKRRCKYLKTKLSHIKSKISEYDRRL